ncbi:MAG: M43 family zinc metalloprotease, partial [Bacteroidota bacterium]
QTAFEVAGRTCVHEVGHYLGLRHIWGDGDCSQEDGIDDTPNADSQSNQDCDVTRNTCTDNIAGTDLPDMVENYMD